MDVKKLLTSAIAGTVAFFILGYLFYGIALADFFQSHGGSATGVGKEMPDFPYLILGQFIMACLVSYIYLQWANIKTFATGAKAGALIGFLMSLGGNLIMYGTTNISDLSAVGVDTLVTTIMIGVGGGVIGWVLGMGND